MEDVWAYIMKNKVRFSIELLDALKYTADD